MKNITKKELNMVNEVMKYSGDDNGKCFKCEKFINIEVNEIGVKLSCGCTAVTTFTWDALKTKYDRYGEPEEGEHGYRDENLDPEKANKLLEERNNKLFSEGRRIRPHIEKMPAKKDENDVVIGNPELKDMAKKQKEMMESK